MGKPSARRPEKELIMCCQLVCAVSTIVEDDFPDHLVEPVGNAVAIMPTDLLRCEIGGDDREELFFITLCQQVNDGCIDVAVVHHFRWLCAEVVNAKHINFDEFAVCVIVVLALVCYVLCIHNLDSVGAIVVWLRYAQVVQQLLECL